MTTAFMVIEQHLISVTQVCSTECRLGLVQFQALEIKLNITSIERTVLSIWELLSQLCPSRNIIIVRDTTWLFENLFIGQASLVNETLGQRLKTKEEENVTLNAICFLPGSRWTAITKEKANQNIQIIILTRRKFGYRVNVVFQLVLYMVIHVCIC